MCFDASDWQVFYEAKEKRKAARPKIYRVEPNVCNCHPETCCCKDWRVMEPDGSCLTTFSNKSKAQNVADKMNLTL